METEYLRVTPHCCEQSTKHKAPYLEFTWIEAPFRWKPIGVELVLPDKKKQEDY